MKAAIRFITIIAAFLFAALINADEIDGRWWYTSGKDNTYCTPVFELQGYRFRRSLDAAISVMPYTSIDNGATYLSGPTKTGTLPDGSHTDDIYKIYFHYWGGDTWYDFPVHYQQCPDNAKWYNNETGQCQENEPAPPAPTCPDGQHVDENNECACDWGTQLNPLFGTCDTCSVEGPGQTHEYLIDELKTNSYCSNGCWFNYSYAEPIENDLTRLLVHYTQSNLSCTVTDPTFPPDDEPGTGDPPPPPPPEDGTGDTGTSTEVTTTKFETNELGEQVKTDTTKTTTSNGTTTTTTQTTYHNDGTTTVITTVINPQAQFPDVPGRDDHMFDSMWDGVFDEIQNGMGNDEPGGTDLDNPLNFSGTTCTSITLSFAGHEIQFPGSTGCQLLTILKTILGWALYLITAIEIFHIVYRRPA